MAIAAYDGCVRIRQREFGLCMPGLAERGRSEPGLRVTLIAAPVVRGPAKFTGVWILMTICAQRLAGFVHGIRARRQVAHFTGER